jgi:hypothetical protein
MEKLKYFIAAGLMLAGSCFLQCAEPLSVIKTEIDSIFQEQLFLNKLSFADQPELSKLKIIVDAEISRIDVEDTHKINWLRDIISNFKSACMVLELLSIKHSSDGYCFLNPLDFVELGLAKAKVFQELFYHDENTVKNSILSALPIRFKKSFWDYLVLGFTQKSRDACWIRKVFSSNFYESYPVLAEEYLDVVACFYKVKNDQEQIDSIAFITKIEKVIEDFVGKISQDSYSYILNIYLSKLIRIKNYFINFYTPEVNSEKTKLLIRFKLLFDNEKIEDLCADNSFGAFFNLYCNVLRRFFAKNTDLTSYGLQLFELGIKLEKIKNDKQAHFLKSCICKPSDAYVVIEEMQSLLRDASFFANKKLNKNESGFLSDPKFDGFKEAAFSLLARTSPGIASALISKISPYLSDYLQEKISAFMGEIDHAPKDGNKILDFISNNPEIFKKLCDTKPELVDKLADVVAQNLVIKKA